MIYGLCKEAIFSYLGCGHGTIGLGERHGVALSWVVVVVGLCVVIPPPAACSPS